MSPSRIFSGICLAFLVGVGAASQLTADYRVFKVVLILLLLCLIPLKDSREGKYTIALMATFFLGGQYSLNLGDGNLISIGWLSALKSSLMANQEHMGMIINQELAEPYASLLNGILLGAKRGLPWDIKEAFKVTGLMHITVASGYNVAVVASVIQALASPLPRRIGFYLGMAGIIWFVLLTGGEAAVVRAGIMGGLALIARYVGRRRLALNALIIAATMMVIAKPSILLEDIGFQLSLAATYGLIVIAPILQDKIERRKIGGWLSDNIKEALASTLAAQAATLPILLFYFQRLSLSAPLANVLVVPFIPFIMGMGAISLALGWIWLPIGRIIAWLNWPLLAVITKTTIIIAGLPGASLVLPKWFNVFIIIYTLGLAWWIYSQSAKKRLAKEELVEEPIVW